MAKYFETVRKCRQRHNLTPQLPVLLNYHLEPLDSWAFPGSDLRDTSTLSCHFKYPIEISRNRLPGNIY